MTMERPARCGPIVKGRPGWVFERALGKSYAYIAAFRDNGSGREITVTRKPENLSQESRRLLLLLILPESRVFEL
jgi:hypothetical protein